MQTREFVLNWRVEGWGKGPRRMGESSGSVLPHCGADVKSLLQQYGSANCFNKVQGCVSSRSFRRVLRSELHPQDPCLDEPWRIPWRSQPPDPCLSAILALDSPMHGNRPGPHPRPEPPQHDSSFHTETQCGVNQAPDPLHPD